MSIMYLHIMCPIGNRQQKLALQQFFVLCLCGASVTWSAFLLNLMKVVLTGLATAEPPLQGN